MRLTVSCRAKGVNETREFVEWVIKLEDGKLGDANDGEIEIDIPYEIFIKDSNDPMASTIAFPCSNMLITLTATDTS